MIHPCADACRLAELDAEIQRLEQEAAKWKSLTDANANLVEVCNRQRERLEKENQQLLNDCNAWAQEVKKEQRLSFRDQVAKLEKELAESQAREEVLRDFIFDYDLTLPQTTRG